MGQLSPWPSDSSSYVLETIFLSSSTGGDLLIHVCSAWLFSLGKDSLYQELKSISKWEHFLFQDLEEGDGGQRGREREREWSGHMQCEGLQGNHTPLQSKEKELESWSAVKLRKSSSSFPFFFFLLDFCENPHIRVINCSNLFYLDWIGFCNLQSKDPN